MHRKITSIMRVAAVVRPGTKSLSTTAQSSKDQGWWLAARKGTPGAERVSHLNNAGSSLCPAHVLDPMLAYLQEEALRGGYEVEEEYKKKQAKGADVVYDQLATLFKCHPDEVAYQESATRAWTSAFHTIANTLKEGDVIISHITDYASNYISYLQAKQRSGCEIVLAPSNQYGEVDVDGLRHLIRQTPKARLISMVHCPSNSGLINPAADIGDVAKEFGLLYLLDGCQSAGQLDVDVKRIGCDAFSATGRKYMRGPRGTGFLYVSKDSELMSMEPALLDLHSAKWTSPNGYEVSTTARRFEVWERNWALWIGLGKAAEELSTYGMGNIEDRTRSLAVYLREGLSDIPDFECLDLGNPVHRSGISTLQHISATPPELKAYLASKGVNVSVLGEENTLLDMRERGITQSLRASVHFYNTEEEVEEFLILLRRFSAP